MASVWSQPPAPTIVHGVLALASLYNCGRTVLFSTSVDKGEMKFKLLFIASLFSVFLWQFAIPSFRKYLNAGVMVDKTERTRQAEDSSLGCSKKAKILVQIRTTPDLM